MQTCCRVRKDEYVTLSEVVKNNLQADGSKFKIHVHRNGDMRVRKNENFSVVVQNNLPPDGTKLNTQIGTC